MPALFKWTLLAVVGTGLLWYWLRRSRDDPARLVIKLVLTAVIVGYLWKGAAPAVNGGGPGAAFGILEAAVCGLVLAVLWVPNITGFFGNLFGSLYDGGDLAAEPVPLYSVAQSRRAAGRFEDAIREIRKQLDKFPHDFMGQMMLATIQAEDLHDLPSAQNTIERILNQPGHTPQRIAAALTHLGDWHLQIGHDPDSARLAFERILALLPATEQAQMATQRLAHLGSFQSTRETLRRGPVAIGKTETNLGLKTSDSESTIADNPAALAARLVQRVKDSPLDWEAREQLAVIYAEHYHRVDLAADQLDQLIAMPHQPTKKIVTWLNLLAELHLKHNDDLPAARTALQRIVDLFPATANAELAKNRIATLEVGRPKAKSQGVALGSYERDLGLKRQS